MWPDNPNNKPFGGAEEARTPDPLLAKQVLSQLSYSPTLERNSTLLELDWHVKRNLYAL